jgi:hypothetical protein
MTARYREYKIFTTDGSQDVHFLSPSEKGVHGCTELIPLQNRSVTARNIIKFDNTTILVGGPSKQKFLGVTRDGDVVVEDRKTTSFNVIDLQSRGQQKKIALCATRRRKTFVINLFNLIKSKAVSPSFCQLQKLKDKPQYFIKVKSICGLDHCLLGRDLDTRVHKAPKCQSG